MRSSGEEFERFNGGSPSFRKNGSARTPRRQNTSRRVCARWKHYRGIPGVVSSLLSPRSVDISLSLSLSLSFSLMTLAATLVRGRSHESYIPSRMFIPRSGRRGHRVFQRFHLSAYIISHCALRCLVSGHTHTYTPFLPSLDYFD